MDFRNYDKCSESIKNLYKQQRTNQNLGYAKKMRKKILSIYQQKLFLGTLNRYGSNQRCK